MNACSDRNKWSTKHQQEAQLSAKWEAVLSVNLGSRRMEKNSRNCPYLISRTRYAITCKGIMPGISLEQGFEKPGMSTDHHAQYCCGNYNACATARMINTVRHEYIISVCPHNSGVDCLHEDECERCGWNPVVAERRLQHFLAKNG